MQHARSESATRVVVGAVSLAVVAGPDPAGASTPTSCRSSAAAPRTTPTSPRPGSQGRRRGPHRRGARRQGRRGRRLDGGHVKVAFRITGPRRLRHRAPAPRSRSRRCSARCTSPSSRPGRPADGGQRDPQLTAPPRRTTSCRRSPVSPAPRERIDTDQLARQPDHPGRPDPQHPAVVPPGARRGLGPVRQPGGPRRADRHPAAEPAERLRHPPRPRPRHRRPDARLRGPLPGSRPSPAGDPRPAPLHLPALGPAHRRWSPRAAPT